jgi:betaine-aldehyde dehydrogenase
MGPVELRAPEGRFFAAGEWREPALGTVSDVDPTDGSIIRSVAAASLSELDAAVGSARSAAQEWAGRAWTDRAALLNEAARRIRTAGAHLALVDTVDSGNPIAGSIADVEVAARALERAAALGSQLRGETFPAADGTLAFTERVPYGVVGRITAYNHPLMFAAQGIAMALVAGNAVVVKPAEHTPLSALELAAVIGDLFPPGVLSVVPGDGAVGSGLVRHPAVKRIAFTGSVATGRRVLADAAHGIKHVTLELGGKNPLLAMREVPADVVAESAIRSMNLTRTNGQSCMSTSRVLVHATQRAAVREAIVRRIGALRLGDPRDPEVDVGPMTFAAHRDRVLDLIGRAVDDGGEIAVGGGIPADLPARLQEGFFVEPTLVDGVEPGSTLAEVEVFGPVIALMTWETLDDAVRLANATEYGLTANILTEDLRSAVRLARAIDAGLVWVNGPSPVPAGTPFGGMRSSGIGREQGTEELHSYTQVKSVMVAP